MMLVVPVGEGGRAVNQHGIARFEVGRFALSQQEKKSSTKAAGCDVGGAPDFVRGYNGIDGTVHDPFNRSALEFGGARKALRNSCCCCLA
jgi:hypothetical protein